MTAVLLAAMLLLGQGQDLTRAAGYCAPMRITGYVRGHHSPWTYDGTSIWEEGIVAASWDIRMNSQLEIAGLGRFRVADRGSGLGSWRWVDVAVWSTADALALTGTREVCVTVPEED